MGSAQSYISPETAVTALVIAGAIGVGYSQFGTPAVAVSTQEGQDAPSKKGKKKKSKAASHSGDISETSSASKSQSQTPQPPSSRVAEFPKVIPGQFEPSASAASGADSPAKNPPTAPSKTKKAKKKSKGKAAAVEADVSQTVSAAIDYLSEADMEASAPSAKNTRRQKTPTQPPAVPAVASTTSSQLKRPPHQSTASIDTDGSWTRVVSNKRGRTTDADSSAFSAEADPTSDAGLTPSVTGESSPAVERRASTSTEDESFLLNVSTRDSGEHRRTLAEKLLPKPRKTAVDDMLESSDFPPTLSRVMRVQPLPNEKPATGFSWGDYEDVRVVTDGGENDADGEDDGWGVVTSKRSKRNNPSSSSPQVHVVKAPETLNKRQRQNAQRKENEKAAKAEAEADRLARLEKHKRELQKARVIEEYSGKLGGKTPSGGMKATVDDRGKLVWE